MRQQRALLLLQVVRQPKFNECQLYIQRRASSRAGINDGSELEAVERCWTRSLLLSRVEVGM